MTDSQLDAVNKMSQEMVELRKLLAEVTTASRARGDKAFDQLYEEMRQYKEDFLFQAEKPLLLDLLLFYDSLNWFQESLIKQEMSPDVVADSFQYLLEEFLEILYRRDVVPMDESVMFDMRNHRAVKAVSTSVEADHQRIAQVVKRGFLRADKTLRSEEVVVLRYDKG